MVVGLISDECSIAVVCWWRVPPIAGWVTVDATRVRQVLDRLQLSHLHQVQGAPFSITRLVTRKIWYIPMEAGNSHVEGGDAAFSN